jgi:molybdopterin synthase catalytic subunit
MNNITSEPIDIPYVVDSVRTSGSGAIDVFIGTTRDNSKGRQVTGLEYEAYVPMALKSIDGIEQETRDRWNVHEINIVHRIGRVAIGEPSVVIAVSSAHRDEAFKACRYLIDRLKETVPIWKREYFADGTFEWSMHSHEQQSLDKVSQTHP